jgi:branched-chain amino acid transport system substrate-binding protein
LLVRAQPSRSTFGARPWRGIAAGVALAVTSALTWGSTTLAQDTNTGSAISGPVRIAVFGPMTGLYAATGKQIWTGAKQCGDEINGAGGILGAQLELVQTDDEGDPGKGTLAAQKVADDTSIVATLGWLNSSVAIPTSDLFAPLNLAMISVGATSPVLTARGHPNVFRVVADDDYQAPAQYLYLKKSTGPKKIALVDESTESTVLMNDRIEILTRQDGVETTRYSVRPQDKDFRAVLGTIPKDVDAMIVNTGPAPLALWVQQAEELGFDVPVVGNDSTLDPVQYIEAAAGAAEGNLVTSGAPDSSVIPSAADFVTEYKELYREAPSGYAPVACVAVQVMADAIKRAGATDRGAIVKALHDTSLESVLGPVSFDQFGNPQGARMYIYKVVGDGFEMVDTITVQVKVK